MGSFFSAVDLMISGLKRAKEPAGEGPSAPIQIQLLPSVAKISVTRQINSPQANIAALPLPKCRQLFVAHTTTGHSSFLIPNISIHAVLSASLD
jgi:hypothetical protein